DDQAITALLEELQRLNHDLDGPCPAEWGIDHARYEELLPTMVAQALASGSPANNPRIPTEAEMMDIYRRAYAPQPG
ncbi:MAG: alcohol dehydrogenase, partial [Magnetospirillum sp.]|nr:alcohol dehydrogenase [Magnetospirillum sp.]